ncbi:interleukin-31 receptor subunit alpha isoform X2 [Brachyhypopomus gauderio]|uniref:interleukin-31 receptor subunit alpha isoform X2 n=2 Tax=Brachyhypopomus gauderio TaxID=698409 RepID=UPI004041A755
MASEGAMLCGRAAAVSLSFVILIGWIWSALTVPKVSAVMCTCGNISLCEKQCNTEANSLECSGRAGPTVVYTCLWNVEGYNEYVLLVSNERSCKPQKPSFHLSNKRNVTIYAIAESIDHKRCTFAKFSSSPDLMIYCGPPKNVNFKRSSGQMSVTTEWNDTDRNVKQYSLKYRERNTTKWKQVESQNSKDCIVGNLTSSLSYEMQIQCVVTQQCPHCPLSNVISVPQELVYTPDIKKVSVQSQAIHTGQRTVVMKWEYVYMEAVEKYNVTVQKASGELAVKNIYYLKSPAVTLVLCYSAYNISIRALNQAGPSPAAHRVIDAIEDKSDWGGTLNVTLNNNDRFNLSWNSSLSEKYHCYLVEWWETGEKPEYRSFYEKKSHHEVKTHNASFQPYKRYHFLLHARPYKNTCNLKNANNSEHTFGRTQAYLSEGSPSAAPGNVSIYKITDSSFVITWNPVSEMDLRGFLQGYIIRYINMTDHSEINSTVESNVNSYTFLNLQSRTMYRVQLSAYTAAGEGLPSDSLYIDTKPPDSLSIGTILAGVISGIIPLLLAVHFSCRFLQRSKDLIWPSVPNPYKSNAVQKIDGGPEVAMLEHLYWQNPEGTEEDLCVVEVKACPATSSSLIPQDFLTATPVPVVVAVETLESSAPTQPGAVTTVTECTANGAFLADGQGSTLIQPPDAISRDTAANNTIDSSNKITDNVITVKPNVTFVSDYTTMELFQQITKSVVQGPTSLAGSIDTLPSNPGQDYIRQALGYTENQQHWRSPQ